MQKFQRLSTMSIETQSPHLTGILTNPLDLVWYDCSWSSWELSATWVSSIFLSWVSETLFCNCSTCFLALESWHPMQVVQMTFAALSKAVAPTTRDKQETNLSLRVMCNCTQVAQHMCHCFDFVISSTDSLQFAQSFLTIWLCITRTGCHMLEVPLSKDRELSWHIEVHCLILIYICNIMLCKNGLNILDHSSTCSVSELSDFWILWKVI